MNTSDEKPETVAKREYKTPSLSCYGSFQAMTLGNSGAKGDGGPGLSKA